MHGCHGLSWCDISCCVSGCSLTFTLGWHTAAWQEATATLTHDHLEFLDKDDFGFVSAVKQIQDHLVIDFNQNDDGFLKILR